MGAAGPKNWRHRSRVVLLGCCLACSRCRAGDAANTIVSAISGATPSTPGPAASTGEQTSKSPQVSPTPQPSARLLPSDWLGIIGQGQSLSVGYLGTPVLSTRTLAPGSIKLLDSSGTYDLTQPYAATLATTPLQEPIRPLPSGGSQPYPVNIDGETPHTAMAAQLNAMAQAVGFAGLNTAHSVVGQGAQPMSVIGKGGTGNAYAASIYETTAFANLAQNANKSYGVGAVVLTHGEADVANTQYEAAVVGLYNAYSTDLAPITGQQQPAILLASQQNSCPDDLTFPYSTVALWQAGVHNPNHILVTGPKYQYPYVEHLHLTADGYRRLGIKYAEVYFRQLVLGETWQPLQPTAATFTQATLLTVTFHVPDAPLVWDETLPLPHQSVNQAWAAGRGFEVLDANLAQVTISAVSIVGDTVQIQLANAPVRPITLQYAITQDATGYNTGTGQGRMGRLRDSDPLVGIDKQVLSCTMTQGQTSFTCTSGLSNRSPTDMVVEAQTSLSQVSSDTQATLAVPWTQASGPTSLTMVSNQYNYCVAFSMAVP